VFPLRDDQPTERTPFVTIALILANLVVYVISVRDGGDLLAGPSQAFVWDYGVVACEVSGQGPCDVPAGGPSTVVTAFTSMFLHGGVLHLGGNMLFLWIFGNNVEDSMGHLRFVVFYLLGGLAAIGLQTAVDPEAAIPAIGASGAVAGVLGGYLLLHPRARVLTLVFLIVFFAFIHIPAVIFLLIWFAQQALFGYFDLTTGGAEGGGVAYFAHIGGFVFGFLAIKLFARRRRAAYAR
jgi:membrane associated rhomboid family serine protease